jgi:hypothetical protein
MGWPRFAALVGRNKLWLGREETWGYLFPLSDQSTFGSINVLSLFKISLRYRKHIPLTGNPYI